VNPDSLRCVLHHCYADYYRTAAPARKAVQAQKTACEEV
jgi:hypothetical protein